MKIYNLTSMYYLHSVIEDGSADMVDEWNTDIKPPDEYTNPRYIDGSWIDVSQEDFDTIAVAEQDKTHNNKIFKQYLIDTDWYISRFSETGQAVPEDILQKRQEARDGIKWH